MLVSALCVQMHYHRCFSVSELTLAALARRGVRSGSYPAGHISATQQRHQAWCP
jgi:hypothetical protein